MFWGVVVVNDNFVFVVVIVVGIVACLVFPIDDVGLFFSVIPAATSLLLFCPFPLLPNLLSFPAQITNCLFH